jgi:sporulation protein YlmC with PRC-barrel domain
MRLDLGSSVQCTDAAFGELADVIVDPISRRVTHIVVEPHGHNERARIVPIDRARPAGDGLALDYSIADVKALEPLHESAYVRAGELVVADPDWDIGIQDVLAFPHYQELDGMGAAIDPDPHVIVAYDRIPKHEVEIRRSSAVISTDGHHLGHVEGFLVGSGETADIVLERGHLWGRREIVIPAAAVEQVQNDSITLSLTKEQVGELDVRHVHRWF